VAQGSGGKADQNAQGARRGSRQGLDRSAVSIGKDGTMIKPKELLKWGILLLVVAAIILWFMVSK
jgi:hypothetical protein